jgi:hypothetical protein
MQSYIRFHPSTFPFHPNRYYNAVAQAKDVRHITMDHEFKRYSELVGDEMCMPEILFRRYQRVLEKKKPLWVQEKCQHLPGSYRLFLRKEPMDPTHTLERQIAHLSSPDADTFVWVVCTVRFTQCEFEGRYCLRGEVEEVQKDKTGTVHVGDPCQMEVGYVDVGTDGRVRNAEVSFNLFLDSKDLVAYCYPLPLFEQHATTHYVSDRDLTLLEEVLRVKGSTLKELVEGVDWKKVASD